MDKSALSDLHRTYATGQEREEDQIRALFVAFKETLKKELSANR